MNDPLLFDSDVLIDVLRSLPVAVAYLKSRTGRLFVSVITVAELHSGVRAGRETTELESLISIFEVIPVDQDTAILGGGFRRTYLKSQNLALADTLIAATAVREGATLVTLNRKHYPMIPNLIVSYAKP
jgi:predicted nucleic acid-binding protein